MIKTYEVDTESKLASKSLESESIYYCMDTGNIYWDSVSQKRRINLGNGVALAYSYANLTSIENPVIGKFYFCVTEELLYMYAGDSSGEKRFIPISTTSVVSVFKNVNSNNNQPYEMKSTLAPNHYGIAAGEFVPYYNMNDLLESATITVNDGSVSVNIKAKAVPGKSGQYYEIFGDVIIYSQTITD